MRLQSREHLGRYKHTMDCLMKVCAEEGVGALTKGLATTCWRNAVWNGAYFSSMHVMKERQLEASATMGLGQVSGSALGSEFSRERLCYRSMARGWGEPTACSATLPPNQLIMYCCASRYKRRTREKLLNRLDMLVVCFAIGC